jgi:hypothetical protein
MRGTKPNENVLTRIKEEDERLRAAVIAEFGGNVEAMAAEMAGYRK